MSKNKQSQSGFYNVYSVLIIGIGILVRLVYIIKSTIYDRQYDIGMIDLNEPQRITGGHLGYIQHLYQNITLPDVDPTTVYQFHHPPLHHYTCVLCMKIVSLFTDNLDVIEEAIQVVPFVCSLVILWAASSIFKRFKLSVKAYNLAMAVMCFHPSMILLSGSVNNDCMALMFTVLCILYAMKWIENKTLKNINLLALFLGLGVSTKQNVAAMALPLGLIFLWELLTKAAKQEKIEKLIIEYFQFVMISIPLGIWFYLRNLVKYGMSMLWVYELPTDSWQYTGNYSVINRFLWPVPAEMIDNLKNFKIGCGYNVWMQIIRTSVLGEWDMASVGANIKIIAVLLMLTGAILGMVAFVCFVKKFVFSPSRGHANVPAMVKVLFVFTYIAVMGSYFAFAYKYPQQCSMNFRYIEITILVPLVGLALYYDKLNAGKMRIFINLVTFAFAMFSLCMCGVWCFL